MVLSWEYVCVDTLHKTDNDDDDDDYHDDDDDNKVTISLQRGYYLYYYTAWFKKMDSISHVYIS
jgi:hypothetical protein